jgi:hypothetical protein
MMIASASASAFDVGGENTTYAPPGFGLSADATTSVSPSPSKSPVAIAKPAVAYGRGPTSFA